MGFECKHCSFCCKGEKGVQVNLTIGDVYRICEFLMITVDEFFEKYAGLKAFYDPRFPKEYYADLGLNMPCEFWKDGKCSVYFSRPINCRLFPYWLLSRAPEEKLKALLKGKCSYKLDEKSIKKFKRYEELLAKVLMREASYYKTEKKLKSKDYKEKPDVHEIKAQIITYLDEIKFHRAKLSEAELLIKDLLPKQASKEKKK